jgi:hypothetical protein
MQGSAHDARPVKTGRGSGTGLNATVPATKQDQEAKSWSAWR